MRASGITRAKILMFSTSIEHVVTQPGPHCSLERGRQTDCIYYKEGRHQGNWCQAPSFLKSLLTSSNWLGGEPSTAKKMSGNISITAYDTDSKVTKESGSRMQGEVTAQSPYAHSAPFQGDKARIPSLPYRESHQRWTNHPRSPG